MGTRDRTRPDISNKPGYITKDGYQRLEQEADYLWNTKRPEVTAALADAAAEGDRSENAEYIYRKRQLGDIDRRLQFLSRRLKVLSVVSQPPKDDGRVYFGTHVTTEDEDGRARTYRIVGPDECDASQGTISNESPLGQALMGRQEGDEVQVRRPKGDMYLTITQVDG